VKDYVNYLEESSDKQIVLAIYTFVRKIFAQNLQTIPALAEEQV